MSRLSFSEDAWNEYLYWQTQDRKTLKKINKLLKDLQRTPFKGDGKPEPLKNKNADVWSRRINKKDRLVYLVYDDSVLIVQCKGHYDDK